jgi:hypothetical protein
VQRVWQVCTEWCYAKREATRTTVAQTVVLWWRTNLSLPGVHFGAYWEPGKAFMHA